MTELFMTHHALRSSPHLRRRQISGQVYIFNKPGDWVVVCWPYWSARPGACGSGYHLFVPFALLLFLLLGRCDKLYSIINLYLQQTWGLGGGVLAVLASPARGFGQWLPIFCILHWGRRGRIYSMIGLYLKHTRGFGSGVVTVLVSLEWSPSFCF